MLGYPLYDYQSLAYVEQAREMVEGDQKTRPLFTLHLNCRTKIEERAL